MTLSGLSSLSSVGGNFRVQWNSSLNSLGLSALDEVGGTLRIRDNSLLCATEAFALRDQLSVLGGWTILDNSDC